MIRIVVMFLSLALSTGSMALAQGKGRLEHLRRYAGTYQDDSLLQDPEVKRLLSMALGGELKHFFNNVSVRGPVDLISGALVISGNARHQGGSEEAIVAIQLHRGDLYASILSQGKIKIFGGAAEFSHLPTAIQTWATLRSTDCKCQSKMPSNAKFVQPSLISLQNATINDFISASGMGVAEDALIDYINAGMDVRASDDNGTTALHAASWSGYKTLAELLVSKGADVNAARSKGWPPLLDACSHWGSKDLVEFLLSNGANINAQRFDGETALHLAVFEGDREVIQLLLAKGANINARDRSGQTPLTLALQRNAHDIAKLLKQRGGSE